MSTPASLFGAQLELINASVRDTFGVTPTGAVNEVSYQPRASSTDAGPPTRLISVPIDPLRLEALTPGQFIVHWVKVSDLVAAGITPAKADQVTIDPDGAALLYAVHQIQEDTGGGVRLILVKR